MMTTTGKESITLMLTTTTIEPSTATTKESSTRTTTELSTRATTKESSIRTTTKASIATTTKPSIATTIEPSTTTAEPLTTTSKESLPATTKEPLATTTTITEPSSTGLPDLISLDSIDGVIYGVHDTRINQDSQASEPGNSVGHYHPSTPPANACDGNTSTKYTHFGACSEGGNDMTCGLDTGFYLELKRSAAVVTGLQVCTANDYPERDPLTMSLEGSNQSGSNLTLGSSWTLIYNGDSGIETDTDRLTCGIVQQINNSIQLDFIL
ncbi:unnamed protein product [Adineta steineri]|uniref:Uncharacterized protein n=1 Tax=Adineta steineri TaxID=433720 RepID=A0A814VTP8_9BILA|nr:unnamed protein product [Adineta steineri]CAF1448259.1 unnamed protein product [Adineta steineri]